MNKILLSSLLLFANFYVIADNCDGKNCCPSKKKSNPVKDLANNSFCPTQNNKCGSKDIIKQAYSNVVKESGFVCQSGGCCGGGTELSMTIGYTKEELEMFKDANLGLGCGHPVSCGQINEGNVVLDLGSGAGLDCFLASRKVGEKGKVIGVDMTQAMIDKARVNAKKYKINNVEFRLGDIESLPVQNNSVDVIISNCVINLATDKKKVFSEAQRVLKRGGKMIISDVVLLNNLTDDQKNDAKLLCACVSGALLKSDYIKLLKDFGFDVTILEEDKEINKKWFDSDQLPIASLKFSAQKK